MSRATDPVLLIYEMVPEETRFYMIPFEKVTDEIRATLEGAHGMLMNSDDLTPEMQRLSEMIGEKEFHGTEDLLPFHVKPEDIKGHAFSAVYWSGFVL